jgi:hypothetical protein
MDRSFGGAITLSITTLGIMTLDTEYHSCFQCYAACRYAECYYTECCGALLKWWMKEQVDKAKSRQNGKLVKWQVNKSAS